MVRTTEEEARFLEWVSVSDEPREVVCAREGVHGDLLTRGKIYEVLGISAGTQIKVTADNGKRRRFPSYHFAEPSTPVPLLARFEIDDPIENPKEDRVDVTLHFSGGETRWCFFVTPRMLENEELHRVEGTEIPFHFGCPHMIVAGELSEELIEKILRFIDGQGELVKCSLPIR